MSALMREAEVPLFSLESCSPVRGFDLVGITLPYELTYTNVLETLDLAGIPLRAADRAEDDPLVVGGGPCAFNPEPVAPFFDAILIGEGEEAVAEIVARAPFGQGARLLACRDAPDALTGGRRLRALAVRRAAVRRASSLGSIRSRARRPRWSSASLPTWMPCSPPTCGVVPFMDVVHDRFGIEVLRGCTRGCRFCQAGMVYRPVRERSADSIVRDALAGLACTGYDEVSLTSLSTTDHSQLEEVLRRLSNAGSPDPACRSRCRHCASTRSAWRWLGSSRRAARRAGSPSRPRPGRSACATS